jgi:hypothetical protein
VLETCLLNKIVSKEVSCFQSHQMVCLESFGSDKL